MHTVCCLLMHSSLAVTTDGLPLGMAAVKFWTRKKFKGTYALRKRINPTRMPIKGKESMRWLDNLRRSTRLLGDPARCVQICDREGDIWELFCPARELNTHFLVRRCSDMLAGDGSHTVASIMAEEKVRGLHRALSVTTRESSAPHRSRAGDRRSRDQNGDGRCRLCLRQGLRRA